MSSAHSRKKSKSLDKRLAGYSLAAGALLAMGTPGNAEVIVTDAGDTLLDAVGESFAIDFENGAGDGPDINLRFLNATHFSGVDAQRIDTAARFVCSNPTSQTAYPYVLEETGAVPTGGPWNYAWYNLIAQVSFPGPALWKDVSNKYMGVKFDISGNTHYGWVKMSTSGGSVTVHSFAYEGTPNTGIPDIAASVPVTLSRFTAAPVSGGVELSWSTVSEESNLGFVVERKAADGTWGPVASYTTDPALRGQGTSSYSQEYLFTDTSVPAPGTYHYRLSDVNLQGTKSVLAVTEIAYGQETGIAAVPLLSGATLPEIGYTLKAEGDVNLAVVDITGRTVRSLVSGVQSAGDHRVAWDGRNDQGQLQSRGHYLLILKTGSGIVSRSVVWAGQ